MSLELQFQSLIKISDPKERLNHITKILYDILDGDNKNDLVEMTRYGMFEIKLQFYFVRLFENIHDN